MKTPSIQVAEAIRKAIEAIRHLAGPRIVDQMTALNWLMKAVESEVDELKLIVRKEAFTKLDDSHTVKLDGALGVTRVAFQRPGVTLRTDADLVKLRKALGDDFEKFFRVIPEKIEPVKKFSEAMDNYEGPKVIRDLIESSVSYTEKSARVAPPRAPKI